MLARVRLPALVLAVLLSTSCGGGAGAISLGVDVDIDRQTVRGFLQPPLTSCDSATSETLPAGALGTVSIDFAQEEEVQGRDLGLLSSVVLRRVDLEIVGEAPGGDVDTFDFLDAVRLFADDPTDDAPRVLVAILDPVPRGVRRLRIPGTGENLVDIASADAFVVTLEGQGRPPCDDVSFVGKAMFALGFL